MSTKSVNMNYYFNVEYFEGVNLNDANDKTSENTIALNNQYITGFDFNATSPLDDCRDMDGYQEFDVFTLYPGLLVGTGNPHSIAVKGAIKQGFSFDYVSGLPYIPGASLKGMLRSYFPGDIKDQEKNHEFTNMIRSVLGKPELNVMKFKDSIFENSDVFLGAFPTTENKCKLMDMEFITSHREKFKNPNPISFIKIRPGIKFRFAFILSDYVENGEVVVSAADKIKLFKELIILMGIGAKTNTGFGRFSEKKPKNNILAERTVVNNNQRDYKMPKENNAPQMFGKCKKCGKPVGMNRKTQKSYDYCYDCTPRR